MIPGGRAAGFDRVLGRAGGGGGLGAAVGRGLLLVTGPRGGRDERVLRGYGRGDRGGRAGRFVPVERRRQDSGSGRDPDSADHADGQRGGETEPHGTRPAGAAGRAGRPAEPDEPDVSGLGRGSSGAVADGGGGGVAALARGTERGQRGGLSGEFGAGQRGFGGQGLKRLGEAFGLVAIGRVDSFE
ncbi:hypothetical protein DMH26_09910 [Streptomyces sp. WAC 05379]|nr:hypothetical protein DMH26_09910 [Streptomyces sp. WAC 05379]